MSCLIFKSVKLQWLRGVMNILGKFWGYDFFVNFLKVEEVLFGEKSLTLYAKSMFEIT